jgi:hypothetical protein
MPKKSMWQQNVTANGWLEGRPDNDLRVEMTCFQGKASVFLQILRWKSHSG